MLRRILYVLVVFGPLAWLLGRALVTDEMFVYRDAAHYYHPLYKLVASEWAAGCVPLWNPYDDLGEPLLADATAAVLYPGKLIFALPLGFDANYKLYIVGHILLCALSAFIAARGFGRSAPAAVLCALSYALSGSVLFQYCNVVYLVGAAWLPLAMLAIDRTLVRRSWKAAVSLGCVLAMIVLGGDAQMAYHVGLVAMLYWMVLCRGQRRGGTHDVRGVTSNRRCLALRQLCLLGLAGTTGGLLAAVQILPSAEWTRYSNRATHDSPRNVYELAASIASDDGLQPKEFGFLLGRTEPGHHEHSYQFSAAPWHFATLIWPNCLGQSFPTNTRWINALPAEGGTWTPTLYMGLLPLVLALSQFRLGLFGSATRPSSQLARLPRQKSRPSNRTGIRQSWLSWTALLAMLASLGWYGLGWIIGECYLIAGADHAADQPLGAPFGGLYWMMQTLLPGYVLFRYPAKWLVVAAMAMSFLAAYGWDRAVPRSPAFPFPKQRAERAVALVRRILWVVFVASLTLAAFALATLCLSPWWQMVADAAPADPLFGPLDRQRAAWGIFGALLHAISASLLLLWLLHSRRAGRWAMSLLMLTAVDVAVAQRNLVPTAPAAQWQAPSPLVAAMEASRAATHEGRSDLPPMRVWRMSAPLPSAWKDFPALDRQAVGQRWDRETLLPRYHLPAGVNVIGAHGAVRSHHLPRLWWEREQRVIAGQLLPGEATLRDLGVQFVIAPAGTSIAGASTVENAGVHWDSAAMQLLRLDDAGARAWIARGENDLQPISATEASCRLVRYEPSLIELEVNLSTPGLLVLSERAYPGWRCYVGHQQDGRESHLSIQPVYNALRCVSLPAGEHRVRFRYRPMSFMLGAAMSAFAWAVVIGLALVALRRRRH